MCKHFSMAAPWAPQKETMANQSLHQAVGWTPARHDAVQGGSRATPDSPGYSNPSRKCLPPSKKRFCRRESSSRIECHCITPGQVAGLDCKSHDSMKESVLRFYFGGRAGVSYLYLCLPAVWCMGCSLAELCRSHGGDIAVRTCDVINQDERTRTRRVRSWDYTPPCVPCECTHACTSEYTLPPGALRRQHLLRAAGHGQG